MGFIYDLVYLWDQSLSVFQLRRMIYIFIVNYKEQTVHIYSFTFVQLYGFLIFLKGEYIQDWLYVPQSFDLNYILKIVCIDLFSIIYSFI